MYLLRGVSGLTAPVLIQKYNLKWLLCYTQCEESKLLKTNSLLSISDQIVQLIAWPIGTMVISTMTCGTMGSKGSFYLCSWSVPIFFYHCHKA